MRDEDRLLEVLEKLSDRLDRHSEILSNLEKAIVEIQTRDELTRDHESRLRTLEADSVRLKFVWAVVAFIISVAVNYSMEVIKQ